MQNFKQSCSVQILKIFGLTSLTYVVFIVFLHACSLALPSNVRITDSGLTANTVELNSSTTLYCSATGTAPLQYQWYHNGTTIPGASSTTYMVTSAQFSSAGVYTCEVSNWAGRSNETYPLRVQGTDVYRHCITRCRIMSSSMPE